MDKIVWYSLFSVFWKRSPKLRLRAGFRTPPHYAMRILFPQHRPAFLLLVESNIWHPVDCIVVYPSGRGCWDRQTPKARGGVRGMQMACWLPRAVTPHMCPSFAAVVDVCSIQHVKPFNSFWGKFTFMFLDVFLIILFPKHRVSKCSRHGMALVSTP